MKIECWKCKNPFYVPIMYDRKKPCPECVDKWKQSQPKKCWKCKRLYQKHESIPPNNRPCVGCQLKKRVGRICERCGDAIFYDKYSSTDKHDVLGDCYDEDTLCKSQKCKTYRRITTDLQYKIESVKWEFNQVVKSDYGLDELMQFRLKTSELVEEIKYIANHIDTLI